MSVFAGSRDHGVTEDFEFQDPPVGFTLVESQCWPILRPEDGLSHWINRIGEVGAAHYFIHEGKAGDGARCRSARRIMTLTQREVRALLRALRIGALHACHDSCGDEYPKGAVQALSPAAEAAYYKLPHRKNDGEVDPLSPKEATELLARLETAARREWTVGVGPIYGKKGEMRRAFIDATGVSFAVKQVAAMASAWVVQAFVDGRAMVPIGWSAGEYESVWLAAVDWPAGTRFAFDVEMLTDGPWCASLFGNVESSTISRRRRRGSRPRLR